MPRFLPPIDNLGEDRGNVFESLLKFDFEAAEGIRDDFIENVVEPIYAIVEQLDLPPWDEYKAECLDTAHDLYQAGKSLAHLLFLTVRPLAILAWMFVRYSFLSTSQLVIQFIDYERSLPPYVLLCQAAIVSVVIGLIMLQRFIRRRRYIPRIKQYFRTKRQRALRRYNDFIAKIAETSTFLALVIPHVLYLVFVSLIYSTYWGRAFIRVFSLKLPMQSILTLWFPVIRTISVISSYHKQSLSRVDQDNAKGRHAKQTARPDKDPSARSSGRTTSTASAGTTNNVSALVSRYSSNWSSNDKAITESNSTGKLRLEPSPDNIAMEEEMTDMIKYWIVYSFLKAMIVLANSIPFSSLVLSHLYIENSERYSNEPESGGMSVILSYWSLRGVFLNDLKFMALIWALLFTSISRAQQHSFSEKKSSARNRVRDADGWKGSTDRAPVWYSSSPIDYVYHQIASTIHLADAASTKVSFWADFLVQKLDLVLSGLVLVRIISESTKQIIIRLFREGTKYIPSVATLCMPGYFTNLGGAYASLIVAIQYSIEVLDRHRNKVKTKKFQEFEKRKEIRFEEGLNLSMIDHLQYYIVLHFIYMTMAFTLWDTVILSTPIFRFIVYWMPQKHVQLLFLLYLQVPLFNGAGTIYHSMESELLALGIIRKEYTSLANQEIEADAEKSITARIVKRAMSSLPRADEAATTVDKTTDEMDAVQEQRNGGLQGPEGNGERLGSDQE